jgi:hypothetical protein
MMIGVGVAVTGHVMFDLILRYLASTCDPPNAEIIEQFRQLERATELHLGAVQKTIFPKNATTP